MISAGTLAGMALSCVFSIVVPLGALLILALRRKGGVKPYAIGALAFFVSQVMLRIPLLQVVLPKMDWFLYLQYNVWGYALFLGLTAALFEETARWIFMRLWMKNNRCISDGVAFGLGHGGIEAVLLVGINCVLNLFAMIALNRGTFDSFLGGIASGQLTQVTEQLASLDFWTALTAGGERLIVIVFHIAASILVLKAVTESKIRFYWLAVAGHTLLDALAVILMAAGVGRAGQELFVAAFTAAMLFTALKSWHYTGFKRS